MMRVTPAPLTPANQNPWYVLMTLFGEQSSKEIDQELHERNRAVWNAWACQEMSLEERRKWDNVAQPDWFGWEIEAGRVMEDHKVAMAGRNGPEFVYPGFPEPSKAIKMNHLVFARSVEATGLLFHETANFGASIFSKDAWFSRATFSRLVRFDDSTFSEEAWFNNAVFCEESLFTKAIFKADASFDSSIFGGQARFSDVSFKGLAGFDGANFGMQARFGRVEFAAEAGFVEATFGMLAGFNCANFRGAAKFEAATFSGKVWFGSARFWEHVTFAAANFGEFAYFPEAIFGRAAEDQAATFIECQFQKPTSFRNTIFNARYPDFAGAILHERTSFTAEDGFWPKRVVGSDQIGVAKASCAVIRQSLGKQGLPEAEHFFYRREMGFAGRSGA